MKLFIDENLSPTLTAVGHDCGYDASCSRDRDLLGLSDRRLLALCLEEERVLVTENAGDFRALCAATGIHPGLILMPSTSGATQRLLLRTCVSYIETTSSKSNEPQANYMLNRVVEIDPDGLVTTSILP